jgi:hypothetical protein
VIQPSVESWYVKTLTEFRPEDVSAAVLGVIAAATVG